MISVIRPRLAKPSTPPRAKTGNRTQRANANPRGGLLGQTSEYALRALAILAELDPGDSMRAADLAEKTGVPAQYLSKVLRRLVASGLLRAQKGHGGGFSLARAPRNIRVADVLEALDSAPSADRCAFGWGPCNAADPCPLHPMWSRLNEAFTTWTSTTTLADVDR
jgi:Rrf2 family protein